MQLDYEQSNHLIVSCYFVYIKTADPKALPIAVNKRLSKKRTKSVANLTKYFNSIVLVRKRALTMAMEAPHTYQSSLGACTYLSIMLCTLVFAVQQIIFLYQRDKTLFTTTELRNYQEIGYSFGPEDGFRVAFVLADDSQPDLIHRDNLVNLEFRQFVNDFYEDGTIITEEQIIPSFPCK